MNRVTVTVAAVLLTGCASIEITIPVNGRIGGTFASGHATARGDGNGTFWVQQVNGGPRCEGKYDAFDKSPELVIPVTCSDGRAGDVHIKRRPSLLGGTATGALGDGTKAQFVFGKDIDYEEEFPGPDATAPAPKPAPPASQRRR